MKIYFFCASAASLHFPKNGQTIGPNWCRYQLNDFQRYIRYYSNMHINPVQYVYTYIRLYLSNSKPTPPTPVGGEEWFYSQLKQSRQISREVGDSPFFRQ